MLLARRTRALDFAFLLASGVALLLALFAIEGWNAFNRLAPEIEGTYLMSAQMRVPGRDGDRFQRVGWTPSRLADLRERLGAGVRLSAISLDKTLLDVGDGTRRAISVLGLAPSIVGLFAAATAVQCDDYTLYVDPSTKTSLGGGPFHLDRRQVQLQSASLGWASFFAAGESDVLAVACAPDFEVRKESDTWVVAAGDATLRSRLQAVAGSEEAGDELFAVRLRYEPISTAMSRAGRAQVGWAVPALFGLSAICALLNMAWSGLVGLRESRNDRIRWQLGGTPMHLLRLHLRRSAMQVLAGAALGLFLFVAGVATGFIQTPEDPAWTAARYAGVCLAVLLLSASVRSHFLLASVKAGAIASTSGTSTVSLWPYLGAWALGLCVACLVAVLTVAVGSHASRLSETSVGYDPDGLMTVPLRFPPKAENGDGHYPILQRMRTELASLLGMARVEAADMPPWRFEGFAFLDVDDGSTGLLMKVSAGFLPLIGVAQMTGRGFLEAEERSAQAAVIQEPNADAQSFWKTKFDVIGELRGLKLGTQAPHERAVAVLPIGGNSLFGSQPWTNVDLVFKSAWDIDRRKVSEAVAKLRRMFPEVAVGEPIAVDEIYALAQRPVHRLTRLLMAASIVGGFLILTITATAAATLLQAQRRELAIRSALGATSPLLVRTLVRNITPWMMLAGVAAIVTALASERLIGAYVVGWTPLETVRVVGLITVILSLALSGIAALFASGLRNQALNAELAP